MKTNTTTQQDISGSYVTPDGKAQINFGITYRNGYAEFHATGHYDGSAGQCIERIAEAYPDDNMVKRCSRWWKACHLQEVNSTVVDAVSMYAAQHPSRSFYDTQATAFLTANGLKLRVTLSDSKPAPWEPSGHHYRVTLSRDKSLLWSFTDKPLRLTFDYFGSTNDAKSGKAPSPYDVLACLSSESTCPDTFSDWCSEFGEDSDSLKARQTWKRCHTFAKRLQAFFTPAELDQLSEIR